MRKKALMIVAILLLVLGIGGFALTTRDTEDTPDQTISRGDEKSNSQSTNGSAAGSSANEDIQNSSDSNSSAPSTNKNASTELAQTGPTGIIVSISIAFTCGVLLSEYRYSKRNIF